MPGYIYAFSENPRGFWEYFRVRMGAKKVSEQQDLPNRAATPGRGSNCCRLSGPGRHCPLWARGQAQPDGQTRTWGAAVADSEQFGGCNRWNRNICHRVYKFNIFLSDTSRSACSIAENFLFLFSLRVLCPKRTYLMKVFSLLSLQENLTIFIQQKDNEQHSFLV